MIRLKRNHVENLGCDEKLFFKVVKQAFQTRRKKLRNALKTLNLSGPVNQSGLLEKRAEQLSVADFVELTKMIQG